MLFSFSVEAKLFSKGKSDFEKAGDLLQFIPVISSYVITFYQGDTQGAKQLTYATFTTAVTTQIIKKTFNYTSWGERPNGGENSFVSGHTSFACSGAAFLTRRYGFGYGINAFVVAATVGASRVSSKKHHIRDVVSGCALSYFVNSFFVDEFKSESEKQAFYPVIGADFIGFQMNQQF